MIVSNLLSKFNEIVRWKGVYNILPSGPLNFFTHECGNQEDLINLFIEPKFEIFKNTNVGEAEELVRSTGVFAIGKYSKLNIKELGRCAVSPITLFIHQYQDKLKELHEETINQPNIFCFDIETYSRPKSIIDMNKYPILGIGYAINDGEVILNHLKDHVDPEYIDALSEDDAINDEKVLEAEKKILFNFYDILNDNNIDILVGFNSWSFDLPYILIRSRIHKIPLNQIAKLFRYDIGLGNNLDEINLTIKKKLQQLITRGRTPKSDIFNLLGRTHLDIYHLWYDSAMKKVALKLGIIEDTIDCNAKQMWTEYTKNYNFFIEYFTLDIWITRELFLRNFTRLIPNLEELNCGINFIATATPSTISTLKFYKELTKMNIAVTKNPSDFNPVYIYFGTSYFNPDNRTKFPGANTGVEQQGSWEEVVKLDVTSFYPSLIRGMRLGVTNTFIVGVLPYHDGYRFVNYDTHSDYYIPDKKLNLTLQIRKYYYLDPIPKIVENAQQFRVIFKRKAQEAEDNNDITSFFFYNNRSDAEKVVNNSMYGLLGLGTGLGNLGSAILTTTLGRFHIAGLNNILKEKALALGMKNPVIELDTDGVVYAYNFNLDECNKILHQITNLISISYETCVNLEADQDKLLWSKSTKNYVKAIYDDDGNFSKWKITGSSLKGQSKTNLENKILINFCNAHLLERIPALEYFNILKNELFNDTDFQLYPINDFIVPKTNQKDISAYASTSQNQRLAIQYEAEFGVSPSIKSDLNYLVVEDIIKYLLATEDNIEKVKNKKYTLDRSYYYDKCLVLLDKN